MVYPSNLANVIYYFKKLPGIGEKSAERLALSVLSMSADDVNSFAASMLDSNLIYILVLYVVILLIKKCVIFVLMKREIRM